MRITSTWRPAFFAAAIGITAAGGLLSASNAAAQRGDRHSDRGSDRGSDRHSERRAAQHHGPSGTITIGRRTYGFDYASSPSHAIVATLTDLGYCSYIEDGCIVIPFEWSRPRISFRAPGYSFRVTCQGRKLIVRPVCAEPPVRHRVVNRWQRPAPRRGWREQYKAPRVRIRFRSCW